MLTKTQKHSFTGTQLSPLTKICSPIFVGPEKQAQVALLLLLICIVFEIYGDPYLMETSTHKILGRLELSALFIEWGTMWSGLMIFQLDDSKPSDQGFAVTLTVLVVLTNTTLLISFVVQFIRAKMIERKAAKLAALKANKTKTRSFFSNGLSALRKRFSGASGASGVSGEEKEVEMIGFENPMQSISVRQEIKKNERNKKMKKVRRKLSLGAKVKRDALAEAAKRESMDGNSIFVDEETGQRYRYNEDTKETEWIDTDDAEEEVGTSGEKKEISLPPTTTKRKSFRKIVDDEWGTYFEDVETGDKVWEIPRDGELVF